MKYKDMAILMGLYLIGQMFRNGWIPTGIDQGGEIGVLLQAFVFASASPFQRR